MKVANAYHPLWVQRFALSTGQAFSRRTYPVKALKDTEGPNAQGVLFQEM